MTFRNCTIAAAVFAALAAPAHADAWTPGQHLPDPGRYASPRLSAASPSRGPTVPTLVDATGQRYSRQDVALGYLPVPRGYIRSGGGLAYYYGSAPAGWQTPGIDTPATITRLMQEQEDRWEPPAPPTPENPEKPTPPDDVPAVPGPLGLAGVAAAWEWARRIRRRVGR